MHDLCNKVQTITFFPSFLSSKESNLRVTLAKL